MCMQCFSFIWIDGVLYYLCAAVHEVIQGSSFANDNMRRTTIHDFVCAFEPFVKSFYV